MGEKDSREFPDEFIRYSLPFNYGTFNILSSRDKDVSMVKILGLACIVVCIFSNSYANASYQSAFPNNHVDVMFFL